eukprot:CAMPEP_0117446410 /NCGR_PEP_ID=MMETSP0759-20121206/6326_1 /TAXON_ID=63605 /ORGANISM="Percolomonas cosmopolitus, Strain WS" /LENGTH=218 /DNA_ID=CAMNT_0005238675 /DNA_START=24 /DNA_END=680 /DNA_ORIENTATION=+
MPTSTSSNFIDVLVNGFPEDYKSTRGIPRAKFIEDIEAELSTRKMTLEELMEQLQQQHSKYHMMEQSLLQQKFNLKHKLPEIERTIDAVTYLKEQFEEDNKEMSTYFKLADNLYMNANVQNENKVTLILGANVMVEYTYEEALELLQKSQKNSQNQSEDLEENLAFLRDQKITTEVCVSRGHNYGVEIRNKERAKQQKKQTKEQEQIQRAMQAEQAKQ